MISVREEGDLNHALIREERMDGVSLETRNTEWLEPMDISWIWETEKGRFKVFVTLVGTAISLSYSLGPVLLVLFVFVLVLEGCEKGGRG